MIKSTTSQYIIIGLVDESKQKNSRCSFKTINAVGYNGKTKSIYYNKGETKVQGKGFKKGDKVSM